MTLIFMMCFINNILRNMFRPVTPHRRHTSPTLWIKTHHITALVITPQTLNNITPRLQAARSNPQTGHITLSSTPYRQLENQSTEYHRHQPSV